MVIHNLLAFLGQGARRSSKSNVACQVNKSQAFREWFTDFSVQDRKNNVQPERISARLNRCSLIEPESLRNRTILLDGRFSIGVGLAKG